MGIHYATRVPIHIKGLFYANLVDDLDGSHSTSSYLFTLGSRLVMWCSKKKQVMVLSSIEADYANTLLVGHHLLYMRMILDQLGLPQKGPPLSIVTIKVPSNSFTILWII
jgi:hypothetical protein